MAKKREIPLTLNLCDIGSQLLRFGKIGLLQQKYEPSDYLVGSYFCDNYFIKETKNLIYELVRDGNKVKCVLPIPSQSNLDDFRNTVCELKKEYKDHISAFVVNDIGTLDTISKDTDIIILGRLFHKPIRDPRYSETITDKKYTPDIEVLRLIDKYKVSGIELENIYDDISCPELSCDIHIHQNYCYMSCTRSCYYASASQPTEHKFRPNNPCDLSCERNIHRVKFQTGQEVFMLGKGLCFKASPHPFAGEDHLKSIIYTPVDELLGGNV
ncbi:MAG: hypothetical protein K6G57_06500 [Lachnospiraceae bacterium]|nr:hypothetical protein [Lachnospiraceae bacterium]